MQIKNLRIFLRKFFLLLQSLLELKMLCSVTLRYTPQDLLPLPLKMAHAKNADAKPLVSATRAPHARYLPWCKRCNVGVLFGYSPHSAPTRGASIGSTANAVSKQNHPTRKGQPPRKKQSFSSLP